MRVNQSSEFAEAHQCWWHHGLVWELSGKQTSGENMVGQCCREHHGPLATLQWTHRLRSPHAAASLVLLSRILMLSRNERNLATVLSCTDTSVTVKIKSFQDNLQSDINRVKDWANEWLLKLNAEKCCGVSYTANIICHKVFYRRLQCLPWTKKVGLFQWFGSWIWQ